MRFYAVLYEKYRTERTFMTINRYDEDTIECVLTPEDLQNRHLSLADLNYSSPVLRSRPRICFVFSGRSMTSAFRMMSRLLLRLCRLRMEACQSFFQKMHTPMISIRDIPPLLNRMCRMLMILMLLCQSMMPFTGCSTLSPALGRSFLTICCTAILPRRKAHPRRRSSYLTALLTFFIWSRFCRTPFP